MAELVNMSDAVKPVEPIAPDPEKLFPQWQADRSPANNAMMLRALDPVIQKAAQTHVGKLNPLTTSKARIMALNALHTYDPSRGRLNSHLYNHMQGLKRYVGQAAAGIKMPERAVLDRRAIDLAARELADELGRDPHDDELADRTGLSNRRIAGVRRMGGPAMSSGYFDSMGEASGEGGGGMTPGVNRRGSGPTSQWLAVVYDGLDGYDKKIFEHAIGYNGQPKLENREIAAKLRRSPGWVSQRKLAIQKVLDREQDLSPFGGF